MDEFHLHLQHNIKGLENVKEDPLDHYAKRVAVGLDDPIDCIDDARRILVILLEMIKQYGRFILGDIYKHGCMVDVEKMITAHESHNITLLGSSFAMLTESYTLTARAMLNMETDLDLYKKFIDHGNMLLDALHTLMVEEKVITPTAAVQIMKQQQVDLRKKATAKAREAMLNRSKKDRATALKLYAELKIKNPKISKDRAAQELKNTEELKHIASVRTIRGYLPKA